MEPVLSLLSLATIILPFCCFGLLFVGMAGFIGWAVFRRLQPRTAQEKTNAEAEAARILDVAMPALLPWTSASFSDLAAVWEGTYRRFLSFFASGRCPSLREPGRALFAFVLNQKGNEGFVRARTSQREVELNFGEDSVTGLVDGQTLGVMRLSTGEIFDTTRQPLGTCRRDQGTQVFVEGLELGPRHRFYPLVLRGREIAKLNTSTGRGLFGPRAPLVVGSAPDLTPEEEDWLLVMCVLEVGYYGPRRELHRARSL